MAVVVLDLGHTGRTGGRPGATSGALRESSIVRRYVAHAADMLESRGHTVELAGAGSYRSRQAAAKRAGAAAWVSCHVNAGWKEGYRGAVFVEKHALGGDRLAQCLADEIRELTGSSRIWQTSTDDWTRNAHGLISGTGSIPAVVYEPVFIDSPDHEHLCEAPEQIGDALACGLIAFLATL